MKMIRSSIFLRQDQKADLRKLAKKSHQKPAEIVRKAIDEYLERVEKS